MMSRTALSLYLFSFIGIVQLWGRTVIDGTLLNLFSALHGPAPYLLPGTQTPLRSTFTGIYPIDYLLRVLVVFFWEVADGSHPSSSAIGLYFLGQYFSVLVVFYLENVRHGTGSGLLRLVSSPPTGIGCTGPLWALSHIRHLPGSRRNHLLRAELQRLSLVPRHVPVMLLAALTIGYATTAFSMMLPSPRTISHETKQIALAVWNVFPIWVFAAWTVLRFTVHSSARIPQSSTATVHNTALTKATLSSVYIPSLILSSLSHTAILGVSMSTYLFPVIFRPEYLTDLHPSNVFLPPLTVVAGETVGDGTRSFMLWDQLFGYSSVILVMLWQLHSVADLVGNNLSWLKLIAVSAITSSIIGPGSCCLLICWYKDSLLLPRK
ncbi:hypothetical protein PG995_005852 [Apiospora arundinis]